MALITIDEYREREFSPEARPCRQTVRAWMKAGKLRYQKRGRRYFVDTDNPGAATGNVLADRILNSEHARRRA